MNDSVITLRGYVGADPVLRQVGSERIPVANFRIGCTPRRLNRSTGEWSDTPTQWYSVSAWRQLGENVARSLRKGDAVVVQGRLMARTYVNKDGYEVSTFDVEAAVVGHDLNRGATSLAKNPRRLTDAIAGGEEQRTGLEGWQRTGQDAEEPVRPWDIPGDPGRPDPWDTPQPAAEEPAAEHAEAAVDAA